MLRIRKFLAKEVKQEDIDTQSSASGGVGEGHPNSTFFQGAHNFLAQGEFNQIQGDQTIFNVFPPRIMGVEQVHRNSQPQRSLNVDDVNAFQHGAIVATRVFRTKRFRHGQVYHGEMVKNGKSVLWKRYNEDDMTAIKEFKRELSAWKGLSHPFLVQFLGKSTPGSNVQFIVLTGAKDVNIRHVLVDSSISKDASSSFIDALVNLAGIYSGLLYLASRFRLEFQELMDCMDASNILVTPNNHAIIGRNLVDHAPTRDSTVDTVQQCHLLVSNAYDFTENLLFGELGTSSFGCWDAIGEKRKFPHLRTLLRLVSWNSFMDFQTIEKRVSDLAEHITTSSQPLRFCEIREAVLSVQNLQHAMSFAPSKPWEVQIYDIGYVLEEEFVLLCNSQDMAKPHIPVIIEDEFITLPDVSGQMKQFNNGTCRFEFNNAGCASVDRRSNSQVLADSAQALRFFRSIAPSLIELYGDEHQIQVSDLVMIVGSINHPSGSKIVFNDDTTVPTNSFYFYALPPGSRPWGYWSVEESETGSSEGLEAATISSVTNPQFIYVLQLQKEDFQ